MSENKLMQQVIAIFSIFMVFFYIGVGGYLIFFTSLNLDKPVRMIMGSTFIFYGLYRAYRSYIKIIEVFFTEDKGDE